MNIDLPLLNLRPYQQPIWDDWFHKREAMYKSGNLYVRMKSDEWHRRAGKDIFDLNILLAESMLAQGNFWFILPEAQQVRNAIWEGITKDGDKYLSFIPNQLVQKRDNQSMKIYLRHPDHPEDSGSIISFVGGDRYDKRVGAGLRGVVVSEHSLQKPNLFPLAIEPMLKETNGFALFNYTPRGDNHATKTHDYIAAHPEKHIASSLSIDDTVDNDGNRIMSLEGVQEERERGKAEELIQQEYYVSREGANFGSYYGDMMKQHKDHVGSYSYDAGYPVHTLWDLGISDQMAIWFVQFRDKDIHVIDYYENSGYALGHYASVLQGKGFMYAMHHLPHDGNQRQLTSSERAVTIQQQLKNLGISPIKIHPARRDIYGAIQRVRTFFSRCYWNKETTDAGYEALKQYQREFDEGRQTFKTTPLHNWCSHAADAFSILPMIEPQATRKTHIKSREHSGTIRIRI